MTAHEIRPVIPEPVLTPDGAPVLSVAYHVAAYPIPPGVPQLGDELLFRVTQVAYHDYRPAGDSVHVTITPAWRTPPAEDEPHCESQGCHCSPSLPCDESGCDGQQHDDGATVACTMCVRERVEMMEGPR
jgi:hypothetical protein